MKHAHYPIPATRDDGRRATLDPFRAGCHATCGACRKRIVFVEGFELRRDYWRLAGRGG